MINKKKQYYSGFYSMLMLDEAQQNKTLLIMVFLGEKGNENAVQIEKFQATKYTFWSATRSKNVLPKEIPPRY